MDLQQPRPTSEVQLSDLAKLIARKEKPPPELPTIPFAATAAKLKPSQHGSENSDALAAAKEEIDRENAIGIAIKALAEQLGDRYAPAAVSAEKYAVYDDRQKAAVAKLREIGSVLPQFVADGRNLILLGTVGTGKDFLLANLLYRVVRGGMSAKFLSGMDLFGRGRDTMGQWAKESETAMFRELAKPEVLGISDPVPPRGPNSEWRFEVLYRLVDRRYRDKKCTWITANVSPGQADDALGAATWDRLKQDAEIFYCDWPSYRDRKAGNQ